MIGRILFFVALAILVYLLVKSFSRRSAAQNSPSETPAQDMVRCAQCGVHLAKEESVPAGGRHFCCEAHRREFDSRPQ
jgi:uncharacterized protein